MIDVVRSVYLETSPKCEPWLHRFLLVIWSMSLHFTGLQFPSPFSGSNKKHLPDSVIVRIKSDDLCKLSTMLALE